MVVVLRECKRPKHVDLRLAAHVHAGAMDDQNFRHRCSPENFFAWAKHGRESRASVLTTWSRSFACPSLCSTRACWNGCLESKVGDVGRVAVGHTSFSALLMTDRVATIGDARQERL